jgi:hypothetical protein
MKRLVRLTEPVPGFFAEHGGARTQVIVPMLKDNALIGAIVIYRLVVVGTILVLWLRRMLPVASAMIASNCRSRATQRHSEIDRS